jgi:hypothetical protein
MKVFSTITSPVFSELVIIIGAGAVAYLPSEFPLFETLRKMNTRRAFRIGVFARGLGFVPEGGTAEVGGCFRLGGYEGPSRFNRLPAHHP